MDEALVRCHHKKKKQSNIVLTHQGAGFMEGNQPYGEGNPEVFFDWLHSIESFYRWYSLSKEQKLFFKEAKLRGKVRIWWEKYQKTHYVVIRSWEDMWSAMTLYFIVYTT